MKKLLLAFLVVAVAAVAAVPYVTGNVLEGRLQKAQRLPGLPKGMNWQVDHFQRGYLHSTATSTLTFRTGGAEPVALHFKHEIDQVPGPDGHYATIHTQWVPQDATLRKRLNRFFSGKPVFALDTRMFLDGGTKSTGAVPAIDRPGMRFSGASMRANTRANGHFGYHLQAAKLAVDPAKLPDAGPDARGKVVMRGLHFDSSGQVAQDGQVWNGKGRVGVDRLSGTGTPDGDVHVDGLVVHFQSARKGKDVAMQVGYGVKHFASTKLSFDNAELNVRLSGLDAASLIQLQKQIEAVRNASSGNVEEDQKRIMGAVMMALPGLLEHGVRVDLDPLKADMVQGPVVMHLSARLPPNAMKGQASPLAMIDKLNIKGDFSLPVAWLDAQRHKPGTPPVSQQIKPLLQKGYISEKDGQISSTVSFQQGHLTVNGIPADDLLASALSRR